MNIAESRKLAAEAKALADRATEGPWEAVPECPDAIAANVSRMPVLSGVRLSATWIANVDMENRYDYTDELESESADRDRHFIAASRTLVPDLADRLVAALDRVEELEAALTTIAHPIEALLKETPKGHVFDGETAVRITDNPHWARDIALKALRAQEAKENK